jgi:hypothetical protein
MSHLCSFMYLKHGLSDLFRKIPNVECALFKTFYKSACASHRKYAFPTILLKNKIFQLLYQFFTEYQAFIYMTYVW